jgi:hypoxanthine-DNA glycosylase
MARSGGFPPIERSDARILVLGSLPGQKSIAEQQYYAHPQNAFWPIMRAIHGIEGNYEDRCAQLTERGIALWDVLKSSVRPGSLDADIRIDSAQPNDFGTFLEDHSAITLVAFNGRKAEQLFSRFVDARQIPGVVTLVSLPSTSPAYAAMPFSGKLSAWRNGLLPQREQ